MNKLTIASLFCGAGGLDIGLEQAGFSVLWANDFDKDACETYRLWSKAHVVQGDIGKIASDSIPDVDVISGGFPCQPFSLAGPRRIDDSRNQLYKSFVRIVEEKKPRAFIGENVKGLLSMADGEIFNVIKEEFKSKGYRLYVKLLNAADYEVPQSRERVILVGIREDVNGDFHFPEPINRRITIADAIGDITDVDVEDVCWASYSSRYMSRNRRRDWNDISFTIPAMAKQVPLHPSSPNMIKIDKDRWIFGEGTTRRLSYKEAALIQTFPRDMIFIGNLVSKYKQIGNAVPVKLGYHVGISLYNLLLGE